MARVFFNRFKLLKLLLIFILVIICFCYFFGVFTYSKYQSKVDTEVSAKIAKWSIFLNSENITDTFEKTISINDITWESTHTESGHAAPGSSGYFTVEIDGDDSEVAFKYDISYTDKTQDENYVLDLVSINSSDGFLVHTKSNNYTGLFSLADINNQRKKVITFNIIWKNDDSTDFDSKVDNESNFLDLKFIATQYHGENIVEYSGE